MKYSVLHISILINLLLIKGKQARNRKGFVELLKEIEFDVDEESDRSEKQYLYKLNKRIYEKIKSDDDSIVVKNEFIEQCINYLKYDSFKDLTVRIDLIKSMIDQVMINRNHLLLLLPEDQKNSILGDVEAAQTQEQNFQFLQKVYVTNWKELLANKSPVRTIVWFVDLSIFQDDFTELEKFFIEQEEQFGHVLLFFLAKKEGELDTLKADLNKESLIGYQGDLEILVQLLIQYQSEKKKESRRPREDSDFLKHNDRIIINTGGGIGIGKIKTKNFNQTTNNISNYNSK